VAVEPEPAAGDQGQGRYAWPAWDQGQFPGGPEQLQGPPTRRGHGRRRLGGHRGRRPVVVVAALVIGIAGLGLSAIQLATGLLPRKFTSAQQEQIMAWEVAARWRELPAGAIFPATTTYPPPEVLNDGGALTLTTRRVGIARQTPCHQAVDLAVAPVLAHGDCQALLRATYEDGTGTYLVTVGVAAFPGSAQAAAAQQALSSPALSHGGNVDALAAGVRTASFADTPAAGFSDARRQLSGSLSEGPYVVLYTIGFTDGRPTVPVGVDGYTYGEMSSMGTGLANSIAGKLSAAPPVPHCPGATGC
jgi:Tfp pilus assembly protein PilV